MPRTRHASEPNEQKTAPAQRKTAEKLSATRREALKCQRCELYKHSTQTVFGVGPADADIMLVGEQPGHQEDLAGQPFVGPAGMLLDKALSDAKIPKDEIYLTNAVKHFKHEMRGKRRMHKTPNAKEIDICKWWLDLELTIIKPTLVVALGATAARALTGRPQAIMANIGKILFSAEGYAILLTIHPSMLLRMPDRLRQKDEYNRFVASLENARKFAVDKRER